MASLASQSQSANMPTDDASEPEAEDLWLEFMHHFQDSSTPQRLAPSKSLLVIGDEDDEKALLVARLRGGKSPRRKGNGLDYHYIHVNDEYCEDRTRLGVWLVDGDPRHSGLLKYALTGDSFSDITVVIVVSMAKPWKVERSLRTWGRILEDHVKALGVPIHEHQQRIFERFRDYVEPGSSVYGLDFEGTQPDLVLTDNLGLDMVVVVTRTEYMATLVSEFGYEEEHFDFIQLALRRFCFARGASLFYVSVSEDRNCDLLLRYLLHRVYGFSFRMPAMLMEKDALFVPAGWDNRNKLGFLANCLQVIRPDAPYDSVIVEPDHLSDPKPGEPDVVAEDDQEFLGRLQGALSSQPVLSSVSPQQDRASPVQRSGLRRVTKSPVVIRSQLKPETPSERDSTLQSFFNSLLQRKTANFIDRYQDGARNGPKEASRAEAQSSRTKSLDRSGSDSTRTEPDITDPSTFSRTLHLSLDQGAREGDDSESSLSNVPETRRSHPGLSLRLSASFQPDPEGPDPPPDAGPSPMQGPCSRMLLTKRSQEYMESDEFENSFANSLSG